MSGNNLNISLIDNFRRNDQCLNTTNTQTWIKTHLNTGLLHMFSASDCQTQAAV